MIAFSAKAAAWLARQFEISRGAGGRNVPAMEGLRGFAVFLVFLVHYVSLSDPWIAGAPSTEALARALHTIGNSGVDLFFVLSGYLIYGSLISRRQPYFRYLSRRIERIYPAFMAALAIYIALSFLFPARSKLPAAPVDSIAYVLENFLLLPGILPIDPIITVAWSLSYEMFFYLAIPLLIALLALREQSARRRVGIFAALALAIACYCAAYGGHVRFVTFIAGILLYEAMAGRRARAPSGVIALSALAVAFSVLLLPVTGSAAFTAKMVVLSAAFFALCFACFGQPAGALAKAFSWTPLRWLGNMSYSYYLLHGLALNGLALALAAWLPAAEPRPVLFWSLLPLIFAFTLVPCAVLFLLVERPLSLAPGGALIGAAAPSRA